MWSPLVDYCIFVCVCVYVCVRVCVEMCCFVICTLSVTVKENNKTVRFPRLFLNRLCQRVLIRGLSFPACCLFSLGLTKTGGSLGERYKFTYPPLKYRLAYIGGTGFKVHIIGGLILYLAGRAHIVGGQ